MLHSFKRWRPFAAERGKSFGCICAGRNRIDLAAREAGHFGRPFWKGPVNKAFEQLHDQRRVCDDLVGVIERTLALFADRQILLTNPIS